MSQDGSKYTYEKKVVYTDGPDDIDWGNLTIIDPKSMGLPSQEKLRAYYEKGRKVKKKLRKNKKRIV